jgi:hypothetical protein
MSCRRTVCLAVLVSLAIPVSLHREAHAQPAAAATTEAGKHFQRGVTMYNEADYRAALVEFRRAYELAPNAAVLYNIGQTYYQLQNYAAALIALGRYLTEAGATAPHRREVEQTIDTLQTRVGKVAISTSAPGADVTVDDELVGKTPLDEPVLVSIGRRKITALRDGRVTETRFVDVAAGDTVKVALSGGEATAHPASSPGGTTSSKSPGMSRVTLGWYITGAFGAIAVGTGAAAFVESRSLKSARDSFPTSHDTLNSKGNVVKILSYTADGAALVALVAGAITFKMSLSESSSHEAHVAIAPNGIQVAGKF